MIRPWMVWAAMLTALCSLCAAAGYAVCDARWTQRDTDRKLEYAEASGNLSEEYRIKEQKLNETIGEIETRGINERARMAMDHKDDIDRLRNASAHPDDGLRIKPALTCRSLPRASTTTGNGHEEIQAGISLEIAERVIGTGAECDEVVLSLDACQAYAESLRNKKPLD